MSLEFGETSDECPSKKLLEKAMSEPQKVWTKPEKKSGKNLENFRQIPEEKSGKKSKKDREFVREIPDKKFPIQGEKL